jgi:fumarate hydratase class II
MGQKSAVDRLPKEYRAMIISLLAEKRLTQEDIVNRINDEAGKQVLSKSAINRFAKRLQKEKTASRTNSLERIATALEKIANSLEKLESRQ